MPRRSPRVMRAKPTPTNILSQPNGAVRPTITGLDLSEAAISPRSAPSFLSDRQPSFSEPSLSSSVGGKPSQLTSPVNELSLEAEFSAVNVAAVSGHSEHDDFGRGQSEDDERIISIDDALSPIKSDNSIEVIDSIKQPDEKGTSKMADGMPDVIVVNSAQPSSQCSGDFTTSTPNKYGDSGDSSMGISTGQATSDGSQMTGTYHTAQSEYSSQSSIERSLSMEYEDRSFMGTQKFADLLQTVAMTASIDDDTSSETSPMPLDITEEDVFKSIASPDIKSDDIQPIGKTELSEFISGSGDDDTPRNTPTPPFAQSATSLVDVHHHHHHHHHDASDANLDSSGSDNPAATQPSINSKEIGKQSSYDGRQTKEQSTSRENGSELAE